MNGGELNVLIERLRSGDRTAFHELYSAMKIPVFTVIYRMVRKQETAEDITQDVFLRLYESPPDASVKNPAAWIFRMARNLAIDSLRRKSADGLTDDIACDSSEERICMRLDLDEAMRSLPLEQREIVAMHLNADLCFREIADVTGLSLPAVYRLYRKALGSIQKKLNGGL